MLKAGFRKCHRRPQHRLPLGCEPRGGLCCKITGTALSVAKISDYDPPAGSVRFTRGRVRELKNGHNSVTVQNQTHVYMNFFHHKDLGNHLLQLCPKVVKHPVYINGQKHYAAKHSFCYTTMACLIPVCFAHFCFNPICQFTPLRNILFFFGLTSFS
jgi:hypothetical protein